MGVTSVFYENIEYFRITRTWDFKKTEIQEYVRIKKGRTKSKTEENRRESFLEAQSIDLSLSERQRISALLKEHNGEKYFHPTGKIIGINRVFRTTKNYMSDEHIFTIRFNKRNGTSPRSTQRSIKHHGLEYAFELSVKVLCEFAAIKNPPLIKLMMDSFKYYQNDPTLKNHNFQIDGRGKIDVLPMLEQRLKIDYEESGKKLGVGSANRIKDNLLDELKKYQLDNPSPEKHKSKSLGQWV